VWVGWYVAVDVEIAGDDEMWNGGSQIQEGSKFIDEH
jgi:hypothetical protein